jgi:hypothetical protein
MNLYHEWINLYAGGKVADVAMALSPSLSHQLGGRAPELTDGGMMSDHALLARIANLLDTTPSWSADTVERIAHLLIANGYRVREV